MTDEQKKHLWTISGNIIDDVCTPNLGNFERPHTLITRFLMQPLPKSNFNEWPLYDCSHYLQLRTRNESAP
jgi:hypothetical protein